MYGFNDPKSKFSPTATNGASQSQSSPVMTTHQTPANSGMVRSDYRIGHGVADGGLPSTKPPAPTPPAPPQLGAATAFGQKARRTLVGYVNNNSDRAERLVRGSLLPANVAGGVTRDVYRGFTGQANPDDGRPLDIGASLPRFDRRLPTTQPEQRTSPSARYVPNRAIPAVTMIDNGQSLPKRALLPERPRPPVDGIYRGKDASGNHVYGGSQAELSEGIAKADAGFGRGTSESQQWFAGVQSLAGDPGVASQAVAPVRGLQPLGEASLGNQAPGQFGPAMRAPLRRSLVTAVPAPSAVRSLVGQLAAVPPAMPVMAGGYADASGAAPGSSMPGRSDAMDGGPARRVLPNEISAREVVGRQGAVIQSPGDSTANKLQRALTSYSVKGSPSTRAAIAQAILGEAGARQAERMLTLRTQDQAALDAQQANVAATEGNANRRFEADKFNVSAQDTRDYRRQMVEMESRRPLQIGQGADGGQGVIREDGSFTPITDANGAAVQLAPKDRTLSPDALLKSYTEQVNAINSGIGTAEEKRAARAELDANPMFALFVGGR